MKSKTQILGFIFGISRGELDYYQHKGIELEKLNEQLIH